ncbi:hypothetical protein FACS189443_3990 [Planctomycetales bacterium]|nr:hypothetical protein FACS189443_3990 [Planctomycetales bacterium]
MNEKTKNIYFTQNSQYQSDLCRTTRRGRRGVIVEFDGAQHYTKPTQIRKDDERDEYHKSLGYTVVRIPYFIQLTKKAVKTLFGADVKEELFDVKNATFGEDGVYSPACLPKCGLERMAKVFLDFQEQYDNSVEKLESLNDEFLTGVQTLKEMYEKEKKLRILK